MMRHRQEHKMRRSKIKQHFKLLNSAGFLWDSGDLLADESRESNEGVWALHYKELL
jgi:hypothetical protein